MNYQDVIKDSKFYLPMNLNLGYLLKDTEIVILMNVINCDNIHEKLSVRKLMRFTNRSNNTVQNALNTLRDLKLIEGFKPNYKTLKYVFDALNNAPSIDERINWCKLYQKTIQDTVSETGTKNVSKTGTQIKKIEKEDLNKEDLNITKECIKREEVEFSDWSDELLRLEANFRKASSTVDIDNAQKAFKRRIEIISELPSEFYTRLKEILEIRDTVVYKLKAKSCYT